MCYTSNLGGPKAHNTVHVNNKYVHFGVHVNVDLDDLGDLHSVLNQEHITHSGMKHPMHSDCENRTHSRKADMLSQMTVRIHIGCWKVPK